MLIHLQENVSFIRALTSNNSDKNKIRENPNPSFSGMWKARQQSIDPGGPQDGRKHKHLRKSLCTCNADSYLTVTKQLLQIGRSHHSSAMTCPNGTRKSNFKEGSATNGPPRISVVSHLFLVVSRTATLWRC
jgi:hypothetical protein